MRSTNRVRMARALAVGLSAAAASPVLSGVTPVPSTIALTATSGPFGPNVGPGVNFFTLLSPRVNRAGVFSLGATTGDITNSFTGVWIGSGPSRTRLAHGGDPVSGMPGTTYDSVNQYGAGIDGAGEVLFDSFIRNATNPALNGRTYFAATPGTATSVANFPLTNFQSNGLRSVAFSGFGPNTGPAVWFGVPGSTRAAGVTDALAPGTPFPTVFGTNLYPVNVNRSSQLLFDAPLMSAGQSVGDGLFVADSTITTLLARSTDPAPGFPAGTTMNSLNGRLGDDGRAMISAYPRTSAGATPGFTLYVGVPGATPRLVAAPETQAPGMPPGTMFGDSRLGVATSPGSFAFSAVTHPAGGSGGPTSVWVDNGFAPHLVIAGATSAPGLPGVGLSDLSIEAGNQIGQILLSATLFGAGVTAANRQSFWVWDPVAGLLPIARNGDQILLGTGLTKTFSDISDVHLALLDPGSPIPGSTLTVPGSMPLGVVTYSAVFTDGTSGVFAVTVPSAGTFASLSLAAALGTMRRRRSPHPQ